MAYREEFGTGAPWNPIDRSRKPCDSPVVRDVSDVCGKDEQKRGGTPVKQAAPMLAHTLDILLLEDMRSRAQLSQSAEERISITRDISLYTGVLHHAKGILSVVFPGLTSFATAGLHGDDLHFQFREEATHAYTFRGDNGRSRQRCNLRLPRSRIDRTSRQPAVSVGLDLEDCDLFAVVHRAGR